MSTQPMPESPTPESPAAKHEATDVHARPLILSALILAVSVALVCLFLIWFFGRLEVRAKRHDPRLSPLVGGQTPPSPRLETSPAASLRRLREAEDRALRQYRWLDKERGVVQLPIDRAMSLLLEEGLPETKAETPALEPPEEKEAAR